MATGGIAAPDDVVEVIHAGAAAAMVGTVLLRAIESGASATHQAALTDPLRTETVLTRAFTGRPARGLRNNFIDAHEAQAPLGYPAIHYLSVRYAKRRPPRANPITSTSGPGPAIGTPPPNRQPTSCRRSPPSCERHG